MLNMEAMQSSRVCSPAQSREITFADVFQSSPKAETHSTPAASSQACAIVVPVKALKETLSQDVSDDLYNSAKISSPGVPVSLDVGLSLEQKTTALCELDSFQGAFASEETAGNQTGCPAAAFSAEEAAGKRAGSPAAMSHPPSLRADHEKAGSHHSSGSASKGAKNFTRGYTEASPANVDACQANDEGNPKSGWMRFTKEFPVKRLPAASAVGVRNEELQGDSKMLSLLFHVQSDAGLESCLEVEPTCVESGGEPHVDALKDIEERILRSDVCKRAGPTSAADLHRHSTGVDKASSPCKKGPLKKSIQVTGVTGLDGMQSKQGAAKAMPTTRRTAPVQRKKPKPLQQNDVAATPQKISGRPRSFHPSPKAATGALTSDRGRTRRSDDKHSNRSQPGNCGGVQEETGGPPAIDGGPELKASAMNASSSGVRAIWQSYKVGKAKKFPYRGVARK
jgi:hypothetical protein